VPPPEETRAALWARAGLQRDPAGLRELLADPFPLARLIGASCLAREESRGAHQRVDHPETDPALDLNHSLVTGDEPARFERWE
jgi:L-aspartate oxidase